MPGFPFPAVGPLGLGSPPSRSEHSDHRYYGPLRPPNVHLRLVRCSLSPPDTLYCSALFVIPLRTLWEDRALFPRARSFPSPAVSPNRVVQGNIRLSQVHRLPLGLHALFSDPGGVLITCHSITKTAAFRYLNNVGFCPVSRTYPLTTMCTISGLNNTACSLAPSGSGLPLPGLPADFATDPLARLWSGGTLAVCDHPLGNIIEFHGS